MDSPIDRPAVAPPTDLFGRRLRDVRISVTDRCNFRCPYCMPKQVFGPGFRFLPRSEILTFEEIERLASLFHALGARKLRLTGGEPLLRRDLTELVRRLAQLPEIEIALTTNGALLAERAQGLAEAGLDRVTVSLDSLDDAVFRAMNDVDFPVSQVLEGIAAAQAAGLGPIKVNAVVKRGVNERTVIDLARHFHGTNHLLRFIEFMDVGDTNGWRLDAVVPGREIIAAIDRVLPVEPLPPNYAGEVAQRYRYRDGGGEIGVIGSVTEPFCGGCTRARLSSNGRLYTCLFATVGTDLMTPLRGGASDQELIELLRSTWSRRDDRYSELRSQNTVGIGRIEMSYIGG